MATCLLCLKWLGQGTGESRVCETYAKSILQEVKDFDQQIPQ